MKQNTVTFKGKLCDIRRTREYVALLLSSDVSGKIKTNYPVIIPSSVYEKLALALGDEIIVLNSACYMDGPKTRFMVSCPSQIVKTHPDENSFSYATFTGTVSGTLDDDAAKGYLLTGTLGKHETRFLVVMSKHVFSEAGADFGDTLLIQNAECYQKDGKFRFRIARACQLEIISRGNLDKGIVKAEDKFI